METITKKKTIHYKRAVLLNGDSTLQQLVDLALKPGAQSAKPKDRMEAIHPESESRRFVNHHQIHGGMTVGQLVFFESGKSQALMTLDDGADFYSISAITTESISDAASPEQAEKIRKEFIDSVLYFGILDNHVIVMQSKSLRARDLETHLAWLLGVRNTLMDRDSALILQDKPAEATFKKLEKSSARSVVIGAPVGAKEDLSGSALMSSAEVTDRKVKWVPSGMGAGILDQVLGKNWFESLNLDSSLDEANVQVNLQITYNRRTSQDGQKIIDGVATALRHMDEADVKIKLSGGGEIKGSELKLTGDVNVKTINGLIDESDLYHQMHSWLVTKVDALEIQIV